MRHYTRQVVELVPSLKTSITGNNKSEPVPQEGFVLTRKRGFMSDELKVALADELGVADLVRSEGWGSVSSRDCGRLVQKAIELAERQLLEQEQQSFLR